MPSLFEGISYVASKPRSLGFSTFPDLYLFMVDDWNGKVENPKDLGFDATYEMPSNKLGILPNRQDKVEGITDDFTGKIVDYQEFSDKYISRPFPIYTRFKTVMAPWDNTPRYKNKAIVCINAEGNTYRNWLTHACVDTYRRYRNDERIVFLHSWNEWAEGTFIEPDNIHGRFRLAETQKALDSVGKITKVLRQSVQNEEYDNSILEFFLYLSDKDEHFYITHNCYHNIGAIPYMPLNNIPYMPLKLSRWLIDITRPIRVSRPFRRLNELVKRFLFNS